MTQVVVDLLLRQEKWKDGLTSAVRLTKFYRNSARKGAATVQLCSQLHQLVEERKLNDASIIVLEADYSSEGKLERLYEDLGLKMYDRYPLEPEDQIRTPDAKPGGLMKGTVGEVLQSCARRLAARMPQPHLFIENQTKRRKLR